MILVGVCSDIFHDSISSVCLWRWGYLRLTIIHTQSSHFNCTIRHLDPPIRRIRYSDSARCVRFFLDCPNMHIGVRYDTMWYNLCPIIVAQHVPLPSPFSVSVTETFRQVTTRHVLILSSYMERKLKNSWKKNTCFTIFLGKCWLINNFLCRKEHYMLHCLTSVHESVQRVDEPTR